MISSSELEKVAIFESLPFVIGTSSSANNPHSLPNVLPFTLAIDLETGLLRQAPNESVSEHLLNAYRAGSMLGTPMDENSPGREYANDFLGFIFTQAAISGRTVLEIGAGKGYLLHLMRQAGAKVLGVEPGQSNHASWAGYGVKVINSFFPTSNIKSQFDVVVGYGVLEHIERLSEFLSGVRRALKPDGVAIFAVPDCTSYVADGDPGMLVHEHWSYFTAPTLASLLAKAGFAVSAVEKSGYGGLLYVSATPVDRSDKLRSVDIHVDAARRFGMLTLQIRECAAKRIGKLSKQRRSLGIYVPGRALMWLDTSVEVRFFDDDRSIRGRYYPPFANSIEDRAALLAKPVDELWIMSRSFGSKIKIDLSAHPSLERTKMVPVDELIREFSLAGLS